MFQINDDFDIYIFWKLESLTIPIVHVLKNIHVKNFPLRSVLRKKGVFSQLSVSAPKKVMPCCEVTFDATDLPLS